METMGSLVDKLTIVNHKIWVHEDVKHSSKVPAEVYAASKATDILNQQRNDLIQEIDAMLLGVVKGKVKMKNYKQGQTKKFRKV